MNEDKIKFISTDSLSVDFFRGERKIAVFTDDDYPELKSITGEYGAKIIRVEDKVINTNSSLIVGIGEDEALRRAKRAAINENAELILIPSVPTEEAAMPLIIDDDCQIQYLAKPHTLMVVKDLINKQPREKLSRGLAGVCGILINLTDEAAYRFFNNEDALATKLLERISSTLSQTEKYAIPYQQEGYDLMTLIYELSAEQRVDLYNSFIASRLFSLYKNEEKRYNNCIFQVAFALYAVYYSYSPEAELILPPDRRETIDKLKTLIPDAVVRSSLFAENFSYSRYVLTDRYDEIAAALRGFPALAKTYLRLSGYNAFERRKDFTANELLEWLPQTAELCQYDSVLKHIYASGYLKEITKRY